MQTITIKGRDNKNYQAVVYYNKMGLAVQRSISGTAWGVVHVGSGGLLGTCRFRSRAAAHKYQQNLLALGVNWQADGEELREELREDGVLLERVRTLYRQHCGHYF